MCAIGNLRKKELSILYCTVKILKVPIPKCATGELGYDRPLYDKFLHMTDDMLGPSPMHIKYSSYVFDGFRI